jgi:DNA-binding HxlR family transcriptional regulator
MLGPMLPRDYESENCSIARALELVGERWTLLVIRDALLGTRRFDDFRRSLGISRNVLAQRLQRLCDEGIFERRRYQQHPERYEYRLTDKGLALWPVTVTLLKWGDAYYAEHGPPRIVEHRGCGGQITERQTCQRCGAELTVRDVLARPGPGAVSAAGALGAAGAVSEAGAVTAV